MLVVFPRAGRCGRDRRVPVVGGLVVVEIRRRGFEIGYARPRADFGLGKPPPIGCGRVGDFDFEKFCFVSLLNDEGCGAWA